MKTLLCCMLLVLALSCKKTESDIASPQNDTVLAEYPDWYTIKTPVDHEIEGVWGSRDKTLIISTGFALFRSTDQGRHWQQVHQQSIGMFGIVEYRDTLFTMTSLHNYQVLVSADNYSIDDGQSWQTYRGHNLAFDYIPSLGYKGFPVNPVVASNGTTYKINQVFLDGPMATTGIYETPGVITSDGRRIDLPQLHQLQSLYLDDQQRLYIAGTDAVCGRGHSGQSFSFCNSKNGRGVVYISKQPLP
ncbi:hypothetical protein [Spirosoma sp. KNUC1025]|uniref:hypothetical protein n=1 Tax=Spirosoma sp. KNUC1025 TaxID=2894082 RepID=UPI00386F40A2|nr:hypothetical protein LN737_28595 [Spirosoma sp. KNUC1025]